MPVFCRRPAKKMGADHVSYTRISGVFKPNAELRARYAEGCFRLVAGACGGEQRPPLQVDLAPAAD